MLLEGPSRMASIRENRCFQQLVLWQAPRVNIPWGWAEELNVVCSTMAGFILENWTDPSGSCVKHRLLWVLLLPCSASPGLQQGSWGQQEPWLSPLLWPHSSPGWEHGDMGWQRMILTAAESALGALRAPGRGDCILVQSETAVEPKHLNGL